MKRISLFLIAAALLADPSAKQVLVPVTVTDSLGRLVNGLDPGAFRLYEDKVEQKVSLERSDLPISVGIVLDTSGSMETTLERSEMAMSEFLRVAITDPADEALLIGFGNRPVLMQGLTHDRTAIENQLAGVEAKGNTALYDAVYLGLTEMEKAKNLRKALLVISDGLNHGSVYSGSQVADFAKKSGVEIYSIGVYESDVARGRTPEELSGPATLRQLSEPTGGRSFEVDNLQEMPDAAAKIGIDLRNQYLLAYTPTNQTHDGRFRKITVKVNAVPDVPSAHAFVMSGYYAPAR